LQPSSKSFLDTYGWILFQQGNYKGALEFIQKAIDANGENDGTLFEHLGDTYSKLGNAEKAIENWKKAKEKGESSPVLLKKIQDGKYYE
jgi:tetratricopeptide (TPR) repeat protein